MQEAAGRSHGGGLTVCHDFSAPLNPLGPPPWLGEVVWECVEGRWHLRYPHWSYRELREAIAARYGVDPGQVVVSNGAAGALHLIPLALHAHKLIVVEPNFGDHNLYTRASRIRLARLQLELSWNGDCHIPLHKLEEMVEPGSVIILSRPNNPTSCSIPAGEAYEAAELARKAGGYLVVDEAYADISTVEPLEPVEGLVIVRSLTKTFATPGLRAGYIVAVGDAVGRLEGVRQPWPVGGLAACVYTALLSDARSLWYVSTARRLLGEEGARLTGALEGLGLKATRPTAPFTLVRHQPPNPTFREELLARGFCVRDASSFHGLGRSFTRISVRTPGENDALLKALGRVLRVGGGGLG